MENQETTPIELKTFSKFEDRIKFNRENVATLEAETTPFRVETIRIKMEDIVKAYFGPGHWYNKKLPERNFRFDEFGNIHIEANKDRHFDVVPATDIVEMFSSRIPGFICTYAAIQHCKYDKVPERSFVIFRLVSEDAYEKYLEEYYEYLLTNCHCDSTGVEGGLPGTDIHRLFADKDEFLSWCRADDYILNATWINFKKKGDLIDLNRLHRG